MDDYSLERDADKLSEIISDLCDYGSTVENLVEKIETLEEDIIVHCNKYEELESRYTDLQDKFQELTDQLAEALKENITHLEIIRSLQK